MDEYDMGYVDGLKYARDMAVWIRDQMELEGKEVKFYGLLKAIYDRIAEIEDRP